MTTIEEIAETAAHNLKRMMIEQSKQILEDADMVRKTARLQGKDPKLPIGFRMTLDLKHNTMTQKLAWGVRREVEVEDDIPDLQQVLPFAKEAG